MLDTLLSFISDLKTFLIVFALVLVLYSTCAFNLWFSKLGNMIVEYAENIRKTLTLLECKKVRITCGVLLIVTTLLLGLYLFMLVG